MLRACGAVAVLLLLVASARAQSRVVLSPGLTAGAGYDDNLFLDPSLTSASATPPRADAIFDVHPSLWAALMRRGHLVALTVDYVERITPSNGDLRDLWLRPEWRSAEWHRLSLGLAAFYEHYEATRFVDNTFDLGGGDVTLRARWPLATLWASYRADARGYSDPSRNEQLDVSHQAAAGVELRPHATVALGVGYRFVDISSNEPTAALTRHRGEADLAWRPVAWLTARAGYAFWYQRLPEGAVPISPVMPGGPRQDWAHAVGAAVTVRPRAWLELFARYDFIFSASDEPSGRYQRNQVLAGATVGWTFARERMAPPPPLLPSVNGHEVTFRARARPGARVQVVGDWNGWQGQPLAPTGGDTFEATYTLPPGRHAWALRIDDAVVTPQDASGFADDGFGGRNALVDVP